MADIDIARVKVPIVGVLVLVLGIIVHTVAIYAGVTGMIEKAIKKHGEHPHIGSLTSKDAQLLTQEIQALRRDLERLEKKWDEK